MSLRIEFEAWADAALVRFEDAFSGRTSSAASASLRSLCRLRCGSSASVVASSCGGVMGDSECRETFEVSCLPIASPLTAEVIFPLLEFALAFPHSVFAEK